MSNPVVNRFLSHPLSFVPAKRRESEQQTPASDACVVLSLGAGGATAAGAGAAAPSTTTTTTTPATPAMKRPKLMAEAVKAYTGKRFGPQLPPKKPTLERIPTPLLDEVDDDEDPLGDSHYELADEAALPMPATSDGDVTSGDGAESSGDGDAASGDESDASDGAIGDVGARAEEEDLGEDLGEDFGEDLGEDLGEEVGEDVGEEIGEEEALSEDADFNEDEAAALPLPLPLALPLALPLTLEDPDGDIVQLQRDLREEQAAAEAQEKHQTPPTLPEADADSKPAPVTADLGHYYNIGEWDDDQGSYSTRIYKNWREMLDKHPVGLINHGVTCYMNTAIQTLIHIPALQHYLNDICTDSIDGFLKPKLVLHTLAELSRRLWGLDAQRRHKYINPKKMIARLDDINCMMSQWQQEDSHEYLMLLMLRLQEDLTPKGAKLNTLIIYDIFGGLLTQKITCLQCNNVLETEQEMYDLLLGFNRKKTAKYTVDRLIKEYFSNEVIKPDRKDAQLGYMCDHCHQRTQANKVSHIKRAPETLVVHLKRFKFDGNSLLKVKQLMKYPEYLDLTQYTVEPHAPTKYRLVLVIVHEGRLLSSGHYVCHTRQPDGSWCTYDDEFLNKIPDAVALTDVGAYVLVYTKLTPKPAATADTPKPAATADTPGAAPTAGAGTKRAAPADNGGRKQRKRHKKH
ncbi:ubiquitin carboxyl-terminal hydrolase [Kocuria palustris]|nr:ubiquitin carboxyl-terminal hydrolase [Kocuria palustris]